MIYNLFLTVLLICSNFLERNGVSELNAIPVDTNLVQSDDQQFVHEYATLKQTLIYDFGYTKECADLVEVNFKRAIKEEKERQKLLGVVPPLLRQGNQPALSEKYDEDELPNPSSVTSHVNAATTQTTSLTIISTAVLTFTAWIIL